MLPVSRAQAELHCLTARQQKSAHASPSRTSQASARCRPVVALAAGPRFTWATDSLLSLSRILLTKEWVRLRVAGEERSSPIPKTGHQGSGACCVLLKTWERTSMRRILSDRCKFAVDWNPGLGGPCSVQARTRVERIAQTIAHKIDRQHRNEDCHARRQPEPPEVLQNVDRLRAVEHTSP